MMVGSRYSERVLPTSPALPPAAAGLDMGSLPDWLAAIGTIGAVLVSISFAMRDGKRLRIERAEAAKDRAEFRRTQEREAEQRARRLASRVTLISESHIDSEGQRFRSYRVHNGGDEPISLATITERPVIDDDLSELSPTRQIIKTWNVIEAGGEQTYQGPKYSPQDFPVVRPMDRNLFFRDGLGQCWLRSELGELRILEKGDPDSPGMILLPT